MFEIIPAGTKVDFIGRRRICALISLAVLIASAAAVGVRGVRLGIDFAGGTEILVRFAPGVTAGEGAIRELVGSVADVEGLSVVRYGEVEQNEFLLRFQGGLEAGEGEVEEAVAAADELDPELVTGDRIVRIERILARGLGPLDIQRVDFVGPRVGAELRTDGVLSLVWASLFILAYITFRFSSRFAPGAIVAVLHDLFVTAGIFVILGLEFDLRILAAMLAILGYSLNDTIIIYDRIRENMALRTTYDLPQVLNESVNQTLARTVLTSGTTLVALASLFFLGGEVIRPFAFAMIIGVIVGTYSSIYIAAPTLMVLEQRFGDERGGAARAREARAKA